MRRCTVSLAGRLTALLVLSGCWLTVSGQYGGPSVLSRGGNQPGRRGRAPVNFTGYIGGGSRYETGLITPTAVTGTEGVPTSNDFGYSVEGGLYGGHDWRSTSVGLDYRGDYRWQQRRTNFNGTNHVLAFNYLMRVNRRLQLEIRETGGSTNRALGGFASPAFVDPSRQGVPLAELFDVRTYFSQTGLVANWTKSARLQFAMQGNAFFIKRRNASLINSQGFDARGNVLYRLDRANFIGVDYQFYKFDFPRAFSGTDAHAIGLHYRRRVGSNINLDANVGVMRLDSFGTAVVELSPEVAAILGRPTTLASFVSSGIRPNIEVSGAYRWARSSFRGSFSNGIGAGNGVYLTTGRTGVGAGYSYVGIRRMALGVSSSWTRTSSLALDLNSYESYQTSAGASYRLAEGLNFSSQIDYRNLKGISTSGRKGVAASFNVSYSTSKFPLAIW